MKRRSLGPEEEEEEEKTSEPAPAIVPSKGGRSGGGVETVELSTAATTGRAKSTRGKK